MQNNHNIANQIEINISESDRNINQNGYFQNCQFFFARSIKNCLSIIDSKTPIILTAILALASTLKYQNIDCKNTEIIDKINPSTIVFFNFLSISILNSLSAILTINRNSNNENLSFFKDFFGYISIPPSVSLISTIYLLSYSNNNCTTLAGGLIVGAGTTALFTLNFKIPRIFNSQRPNNTIEVQRNYDIRSNQRIFI